MTEGGDEREATIASSTVVTGRVISGAPQNPAMRVTPIVALRMAFSCNGVAFSEGAGQGLVGITSTAPPARSGRMRVWICRWNCDPRRTGWAALPQTLNSPITIVIPKLENLLKSQKFLLGDRLQATAL